eukprot:SAG11_NODE_1772_length_4273_cov_3.739578_7_plen_38_part_00
MIGSVLAWEPRHVWQREHASFLFIFRVDPVRFHGIEP